VKRGEGQQQSHKHFYAHSITKLEKFIITLLFLTKGAGESVCSRVSDKSTPGRLTSVPTFGVADVTLAWGGIDFSRKIMVGAQGTDVIK
jgi:hypothetical protein